jgi:hypothetical protein
MDRAILLIQEQIMGMEVLPNDRTSDASFLGLPPAAERPAIDRKQKAAIDCWHNLR